MENPWLRKVGQLPPYDISLEPNVREALGDDSDLYKHAKICISQSFGIAACTYLRRMLENQIEPMVELVREVRQDASEDTTDLDDVLKGRTAEDKIRLANKVLPSTLEVSGDNPLELIYDQLSDGLHRKGDEECTEIASEVAGLLEYVVTSINNEHQQRQAKKQYAERIRKLRGGGS